MKQTATQLNQMKKKFYFKVYINTFFLMSGTGWIKKITYLSINVIFIYYCCMTIILYLLTFQNNIYSGGICERQVEQVTCQTENRSNSNLISCSFRFWILVSTFIADERRGVYYNII